MNSLMRAAVLSQIGLLTFASAGCAQTAQPALTYSASDVDTTPSGLSFHGPFSNETLTIHADHLGQHDFLEITLDLLILRSWDGSVNMRDNGQPLVGGDRLPALGPDYLRLGIADGPTLLYTTFSNTKDPGFHPESMFQNYPCLVPGARLAPQTGATAKNTLGYNYPWPGAPQLFPMDATYHLRFIVPQTDTIMAIQLQAINLQNICDESWGVSEVHIKPLGSSEVPKPSIEQIAKAFDTAMSETGTDQPEAFNTLVSGMDDTANWIDRHVAPMPANTEHVIELLKLVHAGDDKIDERTRAGKELYGMGPRIEPYVRDDRKTAAAEQRMRLDWILACQGVDPIKDDETGRVVMATRVLEVINTKRALEVRANLTAQEKPAN